MLYALAAAAALVAIIRPGVNVRRTTQPPVRSVPTSTGVLFACGTTDRGPLVPKLIQSIADFVAVFGDRQTYSLLYDTLDHYFHEGGRQAYISRVVGPNPVSSTAKIYDAAGSTDSDVSLHATAVGPGSWGDDIDVDIIAAVESGFRVQVTYAGDIVETSGDLADQAAAIVWSANSAYIRLTLGVSAQNPRVQTVHPAGGDDDRSNVTDDEWGDALDLFAADLGPGQVAFPGRTTSTAHGQLLDHAAANNRAALLDAPDTGTVATLLTLAGDDRDNGENGALFAPWLTIPGVLANTLRSVPPSGLIAGLIARNDVVFDANVASAGDRRGVSRYALDVSQSWSEADRQSLNSEGVNVVRVVRGAVENYGWRSLADPSTSPDLTSFGATRLLMQISALGSAILEQHMFDEIDGRGLLFGQITGALTAMLNEFYTAGSLFGATPGDAFIVVCDSSNNTPTTIAAKELYARVAIRISEFAEMIELDLVKVPVNQQIAS